MTGLLSHRKALYKAIVILLGVGAMLSWVFMLSLDRHYYFTAPRQADPRGGRVFVQDVKTSEGVARVYLTRTEKLRYPSYMFATFVLFFTGYFLNRRWKIFPNRSEQRAEKCL
jgi:hypothetical protein